MRQALLICCAALALFACGVDGEPQAPQVDASLNVGSSGSVSMGIGLNQIPLSIFIGL